MNCKSPQPDSHAIMFKWACLTTAIVFGLVVLYMIHDLKRDVTGSLQSAQQAVSKANVALETVNDKLPTIVDEVKKGTETLSGVAEDVKLLKSVAGISQNDRGLRGIANYVDEIQRALGDETEGKDATIKVEAVIGSSLKDVESAREFLVGLNKEAIYILAVAKSKEEALWRVCHGGLPRRAPYYIAFPNEEPVLLDTFIKQIHPESANLPDYKP
ncbi:MAG: hypothetical protein KDB00_05895 [Planctomycetales bacterium]|nr:hypothetical protein [Planctomycetales bacterium]